MSVKLYELSDNLRMIGMRLTESIGSDDDGEIPDDLTAELDSLQESFEAKVDGVCCVRSELLAEAAAYEGEIARLKKLHDTTVRRAEWLKGYLKHCMETAGIDKLNTRLHKLAVMKNTRPTVTLEDGAEIPEKFKRTKEEFDSQAAYEQWKEGKAVMSEWEAATAATEGGPVAAPETEAAVEALRQKVMEMALPPSINVTIGTHIRIS